MKPGAKLGATGLTATYDDRVQVKHELVIDLKSPSSSAASPNAPMGLSHEVTTGVCRLLRRGKRAQGKFGRLW